MRLSFACAARSRWLILAMMAGLWVAACSLNGQPTPPADPNNDFEDSRGQDASSSDSSASSEDTGNGGFFSDAAPPPLDAQGSDAQADVLDASADGG